MDYTDIRVLELSSIEGLLKYNKCWHYDYNNVLEHLKLTLAQNIISLEDMGALEILITRVFAVKCEVVVNCRGCSFASKIRKTRKEKLKFLCPCWDY